MKKCSIGKEEGIHLKLFSNTFNILEHGLDYSSVKQKVISHNIANVDTPNYKAKEVQFKSEFQRALQSLEAHRTHPKHFEFKRSTSNRFSIVQRNGVEYNHNGNSVDIDKEMSELAANQIYYNALIERLNGKFNTLRNVITGGK